MITGIPKVGNKYNDNGNRDDKDVINNLEEHLTFILGGVAF